MFATIAIVGAVVLLFTAGLTAWFYEPPVDRPSNAAVQVFDTTAPSGFFLGGHRATAPEAEVPVSMLLAHLEQHIRYEEAAAEAFLDAPERSTLYSQTSSSWVN